MFDFGIGGPELLVIAVIAIIVVGPKDLPKLLRTVGQFVSKVRGIAREFQGHMEDAARETGLDDVKDDLNKMTNFTVTDLDKDFSELSKDGDELEQAVKDATKIDPVENEKPAAKKTPAKKTASKKPASKTKPKEAPVEASEASS